MRTVAHLSDLHFGRDDAPVAAALIDDLSRIRPDAVVISGDLTQRGRAGQFRAAMAFIHALPGKKIIVPGNHDVPLFNLPIRLLDPLGGYRTHAEADLSPSVIDDEMRIVGVCSARRFSWSLHGFWKDGRVSPEAAARAAQLLSQTTPSGSKSGASASRGRPGPGSGPPGKPVSAGFSGVLPSTPPPPADDPRYNILVVHHPLVPEPAAGQFAGLWGVESLLSRLAPARVDLILSGHLHVAYTGHVRTPSGGLVPCMQAASAVSTRRRGQPNSYNLLEIDDTQVRHTVRRYESAVFIPTSTSTWPRDRRRG